MSTLTTNPARRATAGHRAQVMAEAVVSAYINEISVPQRPPEPVRARAAAHRSSTQLSNSVAHASLGRRGGRPRVRPSRRPALELGA